MTAWDDMQVAKMHPGQFNVPYVAGMNVTNLPTNTFSVSNTFAETSVHGSAGSDTPLGKEDYLLLMWSPTMTAFYGDGAQGSFSQSEKLGGFVIE